jgi:integrase
VITDIVHDAAWDAHGPTDTWPSEDRDKYEKVLEQVFNVTTDQYLEEYIASKRNRGLRDDSVVKIRKDVEALTDRFPYIDQIKRRDISKWITELLHDKAAPTVRRYKSSWAGYWKYLETIEAVDERTRPFDVEIRGNKRTPAPNRQAFTAADVSKLRLAAANEPHKDTVLDDAILMAVYTGMRAREIAMLTPDDVDLSQRTLTVRDAKTKAGHRTIPIHDALMPIIERAVEAGHENVVEYETQSKDRSSVFKSRFSRMKERMGYGPELVFHSLRKTVTTTLENAGIAHHVIDAIQGWERKGMIGRYSDGPNLEMMRRAIDAIRY